MSLTRAIYHVTSHAEMERAKRQGWYEPQGFEIEGFIHCAYADQLAGVLERYFSGRSDLVILEIDPGPLRDGIRDENLLGGEELFPHLYMRLPWPAVTKVHELPFQTMI